MGAKKAITTMIILLMAQTFEKNLFNDDFSPIVSPVMFSPVTPRGQIIYVIYHLSYFTRNHFASKYTISI